MVLLKLKETGVTTQAADDEVMSTTTISVLSRKTVSKLTWYDNDVPSAALISEISAPVAGFVITTCPAELVVNVIAAVLVVAAMFAFLIIIVFCHWLLP